MANLHQDSFDHYATADLAYKGWTAGGSGAAISSGNGRNSTSSLRLVTGTNAQCYVNRTLSPTGAVCVIGFAYRRTGTYSATVPIVAIMDGSTPQVIIAETTSGTLEAYRGSGTTVNPSSGTLLGASAAVIAGSTYYFLEIKVLIANSGGTVEVRVDSTTPVLSLTGLDTQASANAQWAGLRFGNDYAMGAFTATRDYDDLYIFDGSGGADDDFAGDHRQLWLPSQPGNGANDAWAKSTGSDAGALIDESAPDVADYLYSGTAGDRVTVPLTDVGIVGTVRSVQHVSLVKAGVAGVRSYGDVSRIGGVNYDGAGSVVGSDWQYALRRERVSPATGVAWTTAEIDGMEHGGKVTA